MSNLVTQYYVTNDSTPIRVVNSSNIFNQKLKAIEDAKKERLVRQKCAEENNNSILSSEDNEIVMEEGFVDGLNAIPVEMEPGAEAVPQPDVSEEVEKILIDARQEAEKILSEAQQQAKELIAEAREKSSTIYEESKQQGYEAGSLEGKEEVEELKQQVLADCEEEKRNLEARFEAKSEAMERDIVEAMIQVFDKVFHVQFDNKKEILLHLIKNTLMNVEVGKEFRIHVSQNNYKFIIAHLDDVRERVGNDVEIEVVNDAMLDSSDCQIETSFGVFDCGIDMELSNLVKDIRSLCS